MINVQILTQNNEKTIKKTLESILEIKKNIFIGDYGSTDSTLSICKEYGAKIFNVKNLNRNEARDFLSKFSNDELNLWMQPWEILIQYDRKLKDSNSELFYVKILNNTIINWDIRIFNKNYKFINPIFETIDNNKNIDPIDSGFTLASQLNYFSNNELEIIQKWKNEKPLSSSPYYYEACILLSMEKYEDFLNVADHYFFIEKNNSMPLIIMRYYYALVQMYHKNLVKPTLQNLNLCLSMKPLMAEFWCLLGDVYYHLIKNFEISKSFYENAIFLGRKRLKTDRWPMDISKYGNYPKKMIKSCEEILINKSKYAPYSINSI